MANLFNINSRYLLLLNKLEDTIELLEPDENLEDVAKDTIDELEITKEEANDKIEAYYYFIKQQEGEIDLLKDEQERLANRIKSKQNLIQRLKDRVNEALKLFGEKSDKGNYKLKTDKLSVWNVFHKPVILREDFFNKDYMRFKIKNPFDYDEMVNFKSYLETKGVSVDLYSEPDKTKIKDDLKAGKDVQGAMIDTTASYVRFK